MKTIIYMLLAMTIGCDVSVSSPVKVESKEAGPFDALADCYVNTCTAFCNDDDGSCKSNRCDYCMRDCTQDCDKKDPKRKK